ncbi:MAG TPA: NUMOD4 domain-containing protein [Flavobacterium sp.]|jgi:hypothetical protein|nr:NUMOD4 domain-containing protein [Flavobacterium sp.]
MIRFYPNEEFREVEIDYPTRNRYAVSNKGRIISFKDTIENGRLIVGGDSTGYKTLRYNIRNKKGKKVSKILFVYRLVAELFIPKRSEEDLYVIHLDYSRNNDDVRNLRWVTLKEKYEHRDKNPKVINSPAKVRETKLKSDGPKLTLTKVIHLKKLLKDPNRKTRAKILAKQFGISEMQVSRIKRGENWGHVNV